MSDARGQGTNQILLASLFAGGVSALLYLSIVLSFAFLFPLQTVYGRHGRRMGLIASGVAALAVALVQGFRIARVVGFGNLSALALGIAPPLLLVVALALMNLRVVERFPAIYRLFVLVALCSALAVPFFSRLQGDKQFTGYLEERVTELVKGFGATSVGEKTEPALESYESSVLRASLDPSDLIQETLLVLSSSFAAFLFLMLGGSWWIGNRVAGEGSLGRREAPALAVYHAPAALMWPFLTAWGAVLAASYLLPKLALLRALAWNCALVLSLAYAAQGLGIVSYFFKRWNTPRLIWILVTMVVILSISLPPLGMVAAVILPLLGFTEVWIPYRNLKGVGA